VWACGFLGVGAVGGTDYDDALPHGDPFRNRVHAVQSHGPW
jgi:hypothetical protein